MDEHRPRAGRLLGASVLVVTACAAAEPLSWSHANLVAIVATAQLQQLLTESYSHADLRVRDWPAHVAAHRDRLHEANDAAAFATSAAAMLAAAQDVHLYLKLTDGTVVPTHTTQPPANFDKRRLLRHVPNIQSDKTCVAWGTLQTAPGRPTLGYLAIAAWTPPCLTTAQAQLPALAAAVSGLIVDVRINTGGNDLLAEQIANEFATTAAVYEVTQTKQAGTWSAKQARRLTPRPAGPLLPAARVVVLQGPQVMSSNEAFLFMMRAAGATLVGATSRGASANPKPHILANGVTVFLPSWRVSSPDGKLLEGVGIAPDVTVAWDDGADDPVIVAAINKLAPR